MKGVVFTEFLDFVEEAVGADVVDEMIDRADLPSGGAYTAVGKYDYTEMVALVGALSKITDAPAPKLVRLFGRHLFGRFVAAYPEFFQQPSNTFDFLETVEEQIHVEVLKLYPDAELPRLATRRDGGEDLTIVYTSCRPFGELCIGLVEGCAAHFGDAVDLTHAPVEGGLEIQVRRRDAQAA